MVCSKVYRKLSLAAAGGQEWKQRGQAEDLSTRQQNGRGSARGGGGVERRGGFCTDFEDRTNRISQYDGSGVERQETNPRVLF